MNWNDILVTVTQALLIPIITIIAGMIVNLIKKKADELSAKSNNEYVKAAIQNASDIVTQAVAFTTQTYVDALKREEKFDAEAHKNAFLLAKDTALKLLTDESKQAIEAIYGDLNIWLKTKIEQVVSEQSMLYTG